MVPTGSVWWAGGGAGRVGAGGAILVALVIASVYSGSITAFLAIPFRWVLGQESRGCLHLASPSYSWLHLATVGSNYLQLASPSYIWLQLTSIKILFLHQGSSVYTSTCGVTYHHLTFPWPHLATCNSPHFT